MPSSRSTRLNILSDLHLSQAGLPLPRTDAHVVVLAGDIARPAQAIEWARGFNKPVLYVPGNHEFYGGSFSSTVQALKEYAKGTSVHILDNEEIILEGVRFLGSTLWTDFNLYGPGAPRDQAIADALKFTLDFARITSDATGAALTPQEMEAVFSANRAWLAARLDEAFDGPTVVITHHAPSPRSIHPRFQGSSVNCCFVSNSEDLVLAGRSALWIHGHTHDSFDYHVGGTRVLCNPRGYAKDGVNENTAFASELVVDVPLI
ncbi:MAG TPA: metallophosphoesterase [Candidimonas sp.]|nr:metallophosphoesterase [Candidimonas sp.]